MTDPRIRPRDAAVAEGTGTVLLHGPDPAAPGVHDVDDIPRVVAAARPRSDRVYRGLSTGGAFVLLTILVLIGVFLVLRAWPALRLNGLKFFTTTGWGPDLAGHHSGVLAVLYGTIVIAVVALVIAMPIALFGALFLTEFAPPRLRRPITSSVDLLAAVPSLIYGIWGFFFLQPHLIGLSAWLSHVFGFIPIFAVSDQSFFASPFIAGCIVALMVLPVATSVMRESFSRAPVGEKEAALALGGTRWGMIRTVLIPFGRGGIVGGSMLGLGRALSETIAVAIVISPSFTVSPHILQTGGNSVASLIANRFGDASKEFGQPALMAAGLVLFAITLVVNTLASLIVNRSRSGAGVEI